LPSKAFRLIFSSASILVSKGFKGFRDDSSGI
jgi:hypothetical protein